MFSANYGTISELESPNLIQRALEVHTVEIKLI